MTLMSPSYTMTNLPSGTVTFLFIDTESKPLVGSPTPGDVRPALARRDENVRRAIDANGGYLYKTIGDDYHVAFSTAPQAVQAALDAQLAQDPAPGSGPAVGLPGLRMALHTGVAEPQDGDYASPLLNRVARLLAAGNGGQVLLTLATQELARDALPAGVSTKDLGEHRLRDLTRPEHIYQLTAPELPADFPPLKTLE